MKKRLIVLLTIVVVVSAIAFASDFATDGGFLKIANYTLVVLDDTSNAFTSDTVVGSTVQIGSKSMGGGGTFARLQVVLRCVSKPVNNDSTFAWVVVRNRLGDNGTWANVCSTRFTAAAETWFPFSMLSDADTTFALGGRFGDQWRVDTRIGDSTAVGTAVEKTTYVVEAWLVGRKY